MELKDLPPKLIEMLLAIRAQILIRKKHDKNRRETEARFSEEKNDFYFYTKDEEKSFINWK